MMDFNIPVIVDNYGGAGTTAEEKSQPPQYILKDEDGNQVAFYAMMEMGIRRENRKEYIDQIAAIFILQEYLDYVVHQSKK